MGGREEEDREDYRNGFYLRHLFTEIGDLVLRVPRSRKGFVTKVLEGGLIKASFPFVEGLSGDAETLTGQRDVR